MNSKSKSKRRRVAKTPSAGPFVKHGLLRLPDSVLLYTLSFLDCELDLAAVGQAHRALRHLSYSDSLWTRFRTAQQELDEFRYRSKQSAASRTRQKTKNVYVPPSGVLLPTLSPSGPVRLAFIETEMIGRSLEVSTAQHSILTVRANLRRVNLLTQARSNEGQSAASLETSILQAIESLPRSTTFLGASRNETSKQLADIFIALNRQHEQLILTPPSTENERKREFVTLEETLGNFPQLQRIMALYSDLYVRMLNGLRALLGAVDRSEEKKRRYLAAVEIFSGIADELREYHTKHVTMVNEQAAEVRAICQPSGNGEARAAS